MRIIKHTYKQFGIQISSPSQSEKACVLIISLLGKWIEIKLPSWLISTHIEDYFNNLYKKFYKIRIRKTYGFVYNFSENFLSVSYGLQDEDNNSDKKRYKNFIWNIPWLDWTYVTSHILFPDGEPYIEMSVFTDWDERESIIKHCPCVNFRIQDFDGQIINAVAYHEQRVWHRGTGWWKWLRYVTKPMVLRYAEIEHESEVGYQETGFKTSPFTGTFFAIF